MRRTLAAFALAALLSFTLARAAPFTGAFDGLSGELSIRLSEGPLSGDDLAGTAKKQQKAATKALAQLAKTADDLVDDLKSLKVIEKKLRKPFKDEFDPAGPQGTVGALLGDASEVLLGLLDARRDALEFRLADLPDEDARKVQKAIAAYDRYAAAAAPPNAVKKRAPALLKLYAAVRSGEKAAGSGGTPQTNSITALVDGVRVTSIVTTPFLDRSDDTFLLALVEQFGDGGFTQLQIGLKGVTGEGDYLIDDEDEYGLLIRSGPGGIGSFQLVPGTGSVHVSEFDLAKPRIVATFAFDVEDLGKTTLIHITGGEADFSRVSVIGQGSTTCSANGNTGTALVDDVPFTASLIEGVQIQQLVEIVASDANATVSLFVNAFTGNGTYPLAAGSTYADMGGNRVYAATGGSVTVTGYDALTGRIEGTYTMDAAVPVPDGPSVQVRSGAFCIADLAIGR